MLINMHNDITFLMFLRVTGSVTESLLEFEKH